MYKTIINSCDQNVIVKTIDDTVTSFLENVDSIDYQEYLAWLELGNMPEKAE